MKQSELKTTTQLSASMICMDACDLKAGIHKLEDSSIDYVHVDLIDGYFSPSMPIGLDTIRCVRKITSLPFDAHVMAKENDFFVESLLDIGIQRLCFQYETEAHIDHMIRKIKKAGAKAGIALKPVTPISMLEYILPECDFILLMLINPGYANNDDEKQVPYAIDKVKEAREYIHKKGGKTLIEVDGRVSISCIPDLVQAGADTLVLGSSSLFCKANNFEENLNQIRTAIQQAEEAE
jgi:ribulose-phosphate 3-epimerase